MEHRAGQQTGQGALDQGRTGEGWEDGDKMNYTMLEKLSESQPSEVAITLSSSPAFQALLDEREIRHDLVQLICSALSRAFQSRDRSTLQHLAGVVKDSGFLRSILPQYIGGMSSVSDPARREQYPHHLDNIIAVLSKVLNTYPVSSVQAVSVLVVLFRNSLLSLKTLGVDIGCQTEEKLERIQALVNDLQERCREGILRSDRDHIPLLSDQHDNQGEEDLENFRTIPIYPVRDEFHKEERPYLRPNITTRQHANVETYLDTHFRLLREDFVRPLREGIQKLIWSGLDMRMNAEELKRQRFDDISVYFDAKLGMPMCTRSGLAYIVQFDIKPLKTVEKLLDLLETLDRWIDETPPVDQPSRFGNKAYRTWYGKLDQEAEALVSTLLPGHSAAAAQEVAVYLKEAVGNATRIDYGTGHEAAFAAFLCCLCKVGVLTADDQMAIVFKVFN
ncbi:hypothetical protein CRUP_023847, partial [Coryphaenoides rupestris]